MDRTEIVIGANSRIAREYLDYLENKRISAVVVYGTGNESQFAKYSNINNAVKQDVRSEDWSELEKALVQERNPRVIYLAAETRLNEDASFNDHISVNSLPVKKLVDLIEDRHIPLVYISSDMIFGGKNEGFGENDTPQEPFQKYGISKLMGEMHTTAYTFGKVLRLGNVLGTERDFLSSVVRTLHENRDPRVWTNVYNKFTGINEACIILNKLAGYSGKQKIFHVASGDVPMSRYALVERIIPLLEARNLLPGNSLERINKVQYDFRDNRPGVLALKTEITQRELGYNPTPIMCSILEKIDEKDSNYLRF